MEDFRATPEILDNLINSGIPNEDSDLLELVKDFHLHNHRGGAYPNAFCMRDGKYKNTFPKSFFNETEITEDSYANYRRRSPKEGGNVASKMEHGQHVTYDNSNVVPYCQHLLKNYECHINVEYCHSVLCMNYLFKYINKGSDQMCISFQDSSNHEIQEQPN